jgi:hypothetical protein
MGLTRLLNHIPLVHTAVPSQITVNAELATSRPSPNQKGTAWVETFESEGGTFLPLNETSWNLGSRPASTHGLDLTTGIDPAFGFQDADAADLVWQNLIPASNGYLQYTSQQIDPTIVTQGTGQSFETVMWLSMHPDTEGGLPLPNPPYTERWILPHTPGPRWRSLTLPLSATGVDLSRVEYLEFWVYEDKNLTARSAGTTLIFDFGRVYEDAASFVPTSFRVTPQGDTVYSGRRRVGEGRLQTERDTVTGSWNVLNNDTGIWGAVADTILNETTGLPVLDMPLCTSTLATQLHVFYLGNPLARCTRHDGVAESEDLDGDGHLDTLVAAVNESYFRYVFHLGEQRYYVRDGGPLNANNQVDTTGGRWRLYRIPFRADSFQVGAPDIRQVRSLRITVVVPQGSGSDPFVSFGLARLDLVGAPWFKRATTPIAGIAGSQGAGHGEVIASIVSTENRADLGYTPPPGVTDQGATQQGGLQLGPTQINEHSLRLIGRDVQVGERAEAYYQFPEGQRNFLGYRELHVWARGRGSGWNDHELSFFIKVGQDENDFYMFRAHADSNTWLPDQVVDFTKWQVLRSQIEERYLSGQPPSGAAFCGGDSLAYVACDSSRTYIVHVLNPGVSPPNLAQVREMAVGFERDSGTAADSAELWVDDIRLSQVVKAAGYAGAVSVHVIAADLADVNVMWTRRDAQFRQLGESPSYITNNQFVLGTTVHLERMGLDRLGLTAPFAVQLTRASDDPYYLNGTDVLASPLVGLRRPQNSQTTFSLALRRSRRGTLWWQRWLVDNLSLSTLVSNASTTTQLSQSSTGLTAVTASYAASPGDRSFRYVPGFLARLLRAIPLIGRASFLRGLEDARLRWTPVSFQFSSSYTGARGSLQTFRVPIATTSDTLATNARSLQASFRTQLGLTFQPSRSTAFGINFASTRDLKDYGDSTTIGVLTHESSRRVAGIGLGFESARSLGMRLSYNPNLFTWARPRLNVTTTYGLTRDPNGGVPERTAGDSAGGYRLPTAFTNARTVDFGGTMDFGRAMRALLGDSSRVAHLFDRVTPVDFLSHSDLRSQYYRTGFDPSFGYTLGLGGVDAFRALNGHLAVSAAHNQQNRVSSGVRLPLGFAFSASYATGTQQTWSVRGEGQAENDQTSTAWPDVTGRWVWSPRAGLLRQIVTSLSATAGLRVVKTTSAQPPLVLGTGASTDSAGGVYSSQEARSWPVSLTLSWAPRITTNFSYTASRSLANNAGSVTRNTNNSLAADLTFAFRPPRQVLPLKSDIRTALRYSSSDNKGCVVLVGSSECISLFDSGRQDYNFSMDTDMPPNVSAGLALSYTLTTDAVYNRKFAQFSLTVSVTVNFQAGEPR